MSEQQTQGQPARESVHKASYKKTWDVGDFVEWSTYAGSDSYDYSRKAKVGKVVQIATSALEGTDVVGTEEEPALLVEVYSQSGDGYVATGKQVAALASAFWNISPLPVVITKAEEDTKENEMTMDFAKRVVADLEKALADTDINVMKARIQVLKADAFALTDHEAGKTVDALKVDRPVTTPNPEPDASGLFGAGTGGTKIPDPDNGVITSTPNQNVSTEHSWAGEGKGKSVGPGDTTSGSGSLPTTLATTRDNLKKNLEGLDSLIAGEAAPAAPVTETVEKAVEAEEIEKAEDEEGYAFPTDLGSDSFLNEKDEEPSSDLIWGRD